MTGVQTCALPICLCVHVKRNRCISENRVNSVYLNDSILHTMGGKKDRRDDDDDDDVLLTLKSRNLEEELPAMMNSGNK